MIVLDEQLDYWEIADGISRWYKGQVIVVTELRPHNLILDDAIDLLLHRLRQPTFVTINYKDFWKIIPAHRGYCVVCFKLSSERKGEIPARLRDVLQLPEFKTKAKRMGKVISVTDSQISFYN